MGFHEIRPGIVQLSFQAFSVIAVIGGEVYDIFINKVTKDVFLDRHTKTVCHQSICNGLRDREVSSVGPGDTV